MIGAIAGDIIGSVYENMPTKRKDFSLFTPLSTFTDDTVLTVAVADAILKNSKYGPTIRSYARRHPLRGYGPRFLLWMAKPSSKPYNSFGNGSAMRVSPVAHAFDSLEKVMEQAKKTAICTHNHPEGIKGASAVALAVFLARKGADKNEIRSKITSQFDYDLSHSIDQIRPDCKFDITCKGSVPQAIIAFLDSSDFEDAIRNAVSLGADADTQACIAGAIAEAYYKEIPNKILQKTKQKIAKKLWKTTLKFMRKYPIPQIIEKIDALDTE